MINFNSYIASLILVCILYIPSIRSIYKYIIPSPFLAILLAIVLFFLYQAFLFIIKSNKKLENILSSKIICSVYMIIISVLSYIIYPIADALKTKGQGTTADDALIEPAKNFLMGKPMYDLVLYSGVPASAGSGWVILNSPFVAISSYWLFIPLYIITTIFIYYKIRKDIKTINIVIILLSTSLLYWNLLVVGHDLVALSFSFVMLTLVLHYFSFNREGRQGIIMISILAILSGFIASSRVVFLAFPMLLAIFLFKFNKYKALLYGLLTLVTNTSLHLYFYFDTYTYQPMHIFERAKDNVNYFFITIGGIITLVVVFIAFKKINQSLDSLIKWSFVCLAVPLCIIALGELNYYNFNIKMWEGANYFMPFIPLGLFFVAQHIQGKTQTD